MALTLSCSTGGGHHGVAGPEVDFQKGKVAHENGHHLRAIELLDGFEYMHPGSRFVDDALFYLGLSHGANGEQILARQSFQRLLEAFPRSDYAENAYFEIAHSWYRSKRGAELDPEPVQEAILAFETYERRYPNGEFVERANESLREIHCLLAEKDYRNGQTYLKIKRYPAARKYFQQAADRSIDAPCLAKALEGIAKTYEKEQDWTSARETYLELAGLLADNSDRYDDGPKIANRLDKKLASLPE